MLARRHPAYAPRSHPSIKVAPDALEGYVGGEEHGEHSKQWVRVESNLQYRDE